MPEPAEEDYTKHWYDIVDDATLRQGDVFRKIVCYWPPDELELRREDPPQGSKSELAWHRGDYILLSASCDVDQDGYPYALLGRVVPASPENLKATGKDLEQRLEVLRQGLVPSQFLLAPCSAIDPPFPLSVVQHKVHALLPVGYLRRHSGMARLRLRHPLREKFGNWVGSNFSRVGPENQALIPRMAKIHPPHVLSAGEGGPP